MSKLSTWGRAIERLRRDAGKSKKAIDTAGIMATASYYRLIQTNRNGPTVRTLDVLLVFFGKTWNDWARAYQYILWGGDYEDPDWERRYHQMTILNNLRERAQIKMDRVHISLIRDLDKIAKQNNGNSEAAMMAAVTLWVERAKIGGVDNKFMPMILPDASRKQRVARMRPVRAKRTESGAVGTIPKYKTAGRRKK